MQTRHNGLLKEKIKIRRDELLAGLENGVPNWEAYQRTVGELAGLANAEKLGDDVDYEMNGGT